MNAKFLKLISMMVLALPLLLVNQLANIESGFAQTNEDICITVANSSFAPMTNVHGSQAKVQVMYQVNDESIENEKINGIMKLYSSNGTLIHSSSYPEGFVAKKKGGTEDFKTTIRDPSIKNLIANVTFVDLDKKNTLSNTVTVNLSIQESGTSTTAGSTEEEEEVIGTSGPELQEESTSGVPLPVPTEQEGQQEDEDGEEDEED